MTYGYRLWRGGDVQFSRLQPATFKAVAGSNLREIGCSHVPDGQPPPVGRSTGSLVLGLLSRNYLPRFTSCFIEIRFVTELVTCTELGLTRSAQVEEGRGK